EGRRPKSPFCSDCAGWPPASGARAGNVRFCARDWWRLRSRQRKRASSDRDRAAPRTIPGVDFARPRVVALRHAPFFFKGDLVTIEETPQHGDRKALAAIGDQPLLDLEQRHVRAAPDQAQEIVAM